MTRRVIAVGELHRDVAADWHGGQWSPMYAYSSTGSIIDGLLDEIADCLRSTDDETERVRLETFRDYVQGVVA